MAESKLTHDFAELAEQCRDRDNEDELLPPPPLLFRLDDDIIDDEVGLMILALPSPDEVDDKSWSPMRDLPAPVMLLLAAASKASKPS
jgi:hypothetical protein